jgi:hypothetical protein
MATRLHRVVAAQLRGHGLPWRTARISALGQLVLQVPPSACVQARSPARPKMPK